MTKTVEAPTLYGALTAAVLHGSGLCSFARLGTFNSRPSARARAAGRASTLNGPWEVLRTHRNDQSLKVEADPQAPWAVDGQRAFRCFRVRQAASGYLCCTGIELYGQMQE